MGTYSTPLQNTQSNENAYLSVTPLPFELGLLLECHGIALIKENWLKRFPHALIAPMFTQDVGWVKTAGGVSELDCARGDGFADEVICQHVVAFVELAMWMG